MTQHDPDTKDAPCPNGPTVYFDGACALCTAEIKLYTSRPGGDQINLVDVSQDPARLTARLGPGLTREDALQRFHVRLPDGQLVSGARAFFAIWESLPGWKHAAKIARLPGALPLFDLGYRLFLPIRPALSRLAARLGAKPANPGGDRG